MKSFKQAMFGMMAALTMTVFVAVPAFAAYNPIGDSAACKETGKSRPAVCNDLNVADGKQAVNATVQNVIDILFYVIGIIAVIMIIVGGIKYTTSNGDSTALTSAKNTILYAVVGLVVALMAYTIVNFVIGRI